MHSFGMWKPVVVLVVLAMLAAACVDESAEDAEPEATPTETPVDGSGGGADSDPAADDGEPSVDDSDPAADDGEPSVDDSDPAADDGEPSVDDSESSDDEPVDPDVPLTASDTGVSETTITVGIPLLDLELLAEFGIIETADPDLVAGFETAIGTVNQAGGIHGRQLKAVYAEFLPLGTAASDAACIELVEDNEIFAAIGTLIVPEGVLCYTELNGTPYIGWLGSYTQEVIERSPEATIGIEATIERYITAMIDHAEIQGDLDRPLAVHGDDQGRIEAAVQELESRGANVVSISTVSAPEGDEAARIGEFVGIFERWRSDGAEVVINVGVSFDVAVAMAREEFYLPVYGAEGGASNYFPDEPREIEAIEQFTLVYGSADLPEDDPLNQACKDAWDAANPDRPFAVLDEDEFADEHLFAALGPCGAITLFAAIAEAAGPVLTHESFAEAAAELGTVRLPGFGDIRLGSPDIAGPVSVGVWRYGAVEDQFVQVGEVPLS